MSDKPDIHEVARQLAVLEERMETKQAGHESALERLRADGAARETRLILAMAGMIALAVAFLAYWEPTPTAPNPAVVVVPAGWQGSVPDSGIADTVSPAEAENQG
ncbi:MAG: hypothetical protein F4213_20315 [Boseongicola sp. SB0677_bin_26]|nr:hypothetical protein [Boseongicola sp. SB0677_bin_26]